MAKSRSKGYDKKIPTKTVYHTQGLDGTMDYKLTRPNIIQDYTIHIIVDGNFLTIMVIIFNLLSLPSLNRPLPLNLFHVCNMLC